MYFTAKNLICFYMTSTHQYSNTKNWKQLFRWIFCTRERIGLHPKSTSTFNYIQWMIDADLILIVSYCGAAKNWSRLERFGASRCESQIARAQITCMGGWKDATTLFCTKIAKYNILRRNAEKSIKRQFLNNRNSSLICNYLKREWFKYSQQQPIWDRLDIHFKSKKG